MMASSDTGLALATADRMEDMCLPLGTSSRLGGAKYRHSSLVWSREILPGRNRGAHMFIWNAEDNQSTSTNVGYIMSHYWAENLAALGLHVQRRIF